MSRSWRLNAQGYVIVHVFDLVRKKSMLFSLHRMVARATDGVLVDHVRGNLLDCRRCALRWATASQNSANRRDDRTGRSSRFRGVTWHRSGRWQAQLKHREVNRYLGLFKEEIQAALAYNQAARAIWGRFANLNRLPRSARRAA